MEEPCLPSSVLCIFILVLAVKFFLKKGKQHQNLPPSPPALPIIGHLHLLKQPIHRTFYDLSQKHGPIFSLKLGPRQAIVVSSSSLAEECLSKNDIVFANRPSYPSGSHLTYNHTTMAAAPYGDYWRNLRRIGSIEIFSSSRLNTFLDLQKDEVKRLLRRLYGVSKHGFAKVELRPLFMDLTFNIIMRIVAGKRYYGEEEDYNLGEEAEEAKEFKEIVTEFFKCTETTNPADIFPLLRFLDYTGFENRCIRISKRLDLFMQALIDKHRNCKDGNTLIGRLLTLQQSQPEVYTEEIIKRLIQVN
ncbi:hypothetical protein Tsubulata_025117 [Turnera subulata]|uniref:Cytochrome P450 n=1 Tax=Turnera subulata TaxID=218843 RepID=A0A9Q0G5K4_9ROSI|nr:hypothetical protein Tsubulata_025117 [Turnera subulata]